MLHVDVIEKTSKLPGYFCVERLEDDIFELYAIDATGERHRFKTWSTKIVRCPVGWTIRFSVDIIETQKDIVETEITELDRPVLRTE